jgi:hypothetical protein
MRTSSAMYGALIALRFTVCWAGQGLPPFPAPLSPLAALSLRSAPDTFLLTKPNTSCTIEMPASLRSEGVRVHPGMPSESAFGFAGVLSRPSVLLRAYVEATLSARLHPVPEVLQTSGSTGTQSRGSSSVNRCRQQSSGSHHPHGAVFDRHAAKRTGAAAHRGHRQYAHGRSHSTGQGRQGSRCASLPEVAGNPPRVLALAKAQSLAVSADWISRKYRAHNGPHCLVCVR